MQRVTGDGIGLPPGLDFGKGESLGLQLVPDLTCQLRGTLAVVRDNGITFAETAPPGRGESLSLRDSVSTGSGQNHAGHLVRLGDHRDVTGR